MIIPKRIEEFERMGLGMFVHWGLYSQLGMGEWTYHISKMNMNEYKKLAETFTAEDFDARELVSVAKKAGCKYITLTTRHHEGFSLYDTCGLNEFDAPHTPAKRDIIREFVDACNESGIAPFFYHTTLDWYNKDFDENFDKYLEYLRKSVEILCTNYGKIGGLWFDGNWSRPNNDWKVWELYATIRKHQPEAIIVNNTGMVARGTVGDPEVDVLTFEQGRPAPINRDGMDKYLAAEACYTLNDHWGVGYNDFNYKSPKELIEMVCDCRKVGANLLINIGPGPQGNIIPMQKALLEILGNWMNIFGEAIYNGKTYNSHCVGRNFVLKGDGCLYIFCYDLGIYGNENVTVASDGKYCGIYAFSNIDDKIKSIKWMDNSEELKFVQNNSDLTVHLTGMPYGTEYCVRVAKAVID